MTWNFPEPIAMQLKAAAVVVAVLVVVEAVVRLRLLSQLQPLTSQKTAEQLLLQEPFLVPLLLMP